jgi:hypothetical protein
MGNRAEEEDGRKRLHRVATAGVIGMFHEVIKIITIYHSTPDENVSPRIPVLSEHVMITRRSNSRGISFRADFNVHS